MFLRRIGPDLEASGVRCAGCCNCPDIWELDNGDFAVIGADITEVAMPHLPADAGCGSDERIVRLPRRLLINAKRDIPDTL